MRAYENRSGDRVTVANHFHRRDFNISNVLQLKSKILVEKDSIQLKSEKPHSILF